MNPKQKTKAEKAKEAEEATEDWYEKADPKGNYLPKLEGINYYELLSEGELSTSKIKDKDIVSVIFDAIHHETNNVHGKAIADSPESPVEGILRIPLSAARKIRACMEEKEIPKAQLIGSILALQKTGTEINTRYPSVEILAKEDYFE